MNFVKTGLAMACFVDDPIIGIAGTDELRSRLFTKITLLWAALGFWLAWAKACRGTTLVWLGVQLAIDMRLRTVCLTLPADKLATSINGKQPFIWRVVILFFSEFLCVFFFGTW